MREVHERSASGRDLAYTTVMTVLDRLAKKGLVAQRTRRPGLPVPRRRPRSAMTADLMRDALDEFALQDRRDRRTALVAFVGEASAEERAALREALADLDDG